MNNEAEGCGTHRSPCLTAKTCGLIAETRDRVDIVADSGDRVRPVSPQGARIVLIHPRARVTVHDVNRNFIPQCFKVVCESKVRMPVLDIKSQSVFEDVRGG